MDKEALAERTLNLAQPGTQFALITIVAVIQLIAAAVSILKNCGYLDSDIQNKVSKPNWLMRFRLKRLARKHIADAKLADAVAEALPVAASELNPAQFAMVYHQE